MPWPGPERSGQHEAAWHTLQAALRLGTRDPSLAYHAGVIAFHRGDLARARTELSTALQLSPRWHRREAAEAQAPARSAAAAYALSAAPSRIRSHRLANGRPGPLGDHRYQAALGKAGQGIDLKAHRAAVVGEDQGRCASRQRSPGHGGRDEPGPAPAGARRRERRRHQVPVSVRSYLAA